MTGLKNSVEDDVEVLLDQLLPTMPNICNCSTCKLNMASFALNRLKPNYVTSDKGTLYHKLDNLTPQKKMDTLTVVLNAINVIGANPKH